MHTWSSQWTFWHCIWFNIRKTILTGADSSRDLMTNSNIMIESGSRLELVPVSSLNHGLPYLGAVISFDLDWSYGISKINQRIGWYMNCIRREQLPIHRAIYVINNFLIPSISYALSFVFPTAAEASSWDKQITLTISNLLGENGARRVSPPALACIAGAILPSYQWTLIQISETFVRLNMSDKYSTTSRSRWNARNFSRMSRVLKLAADIGLTFKRVTHSHRSWSSDDFIPPSTSSRITFRCVTTVDDNECTILNGYYGVWGLGLPPPAATITMCTDGSASGRGERVASAWSVCIINDWLRDNYQMIPDEGKFNNTLNHVCSISGHIMSNDSQGVYDAELQAICRALLSVPPNTSLDIYSDSQSSLVSIHSYLTCTSEREKLRRNGRPWLALITRLLRLRDSHHSTTRLLPIKAHTKLTTLPHIGNRCADFIAKQALRSNSPITPPLPLHLEEDFVCLRDSKTDRLITADPRKTCRQYLNNHMRFLWSKSSSQSLFSSDLIDSRALYTLVSIKRPHLIGFVLRVLTDIIQWHRDPNDRKIVSERTCQKHKHTILNTTHLLT